MTGYSLLNNQTMSKSKANSFNPGFLLIAAVLLIVAWELYLLYSLLYQNLSSQVSDTIGSVVRLDLNSYNHTLQLIDSEKNFAPQPANLRNPNPFK